MLLLLNENNTVVHVGQHLTSVHKEDNNTKLCDYK